MVYLLQLSQLGLFLVEDAFPLQEIVAALHRFTRDTSVATKSL